MKLSPLDVHNIAIITANHYRSVKTHHRNTYYTPNKKKIEFLIKCGENKYWVLK